MKKLEFMSKNFVAFLLMSIFIYITSIGINIYLFSCVNETVNADVAVILGASVWHNKPSPVFQERINHGIWLYKNGYVKYLIFTGGIGKNSNMSESSVAKEYAIKNFVPDEKIFIEEISRITFENIVYAGNIIREHNFNKIIIVSDPLHMKRAITMARDNNLKVYSSPTPTTRYITIKTKLNFLLYETFFYLAYEIYKYSVFLFIYFIFVALLILIYKFIMFRQNCA
jgi:uncharacterized SAM-binding protein YcdF (DUF218 family)